MSSFTIVNVAKFAIQSFSQAVRSAGEMIVCVLKARYSILIADTTDGKAVVFVIGVFRHSTCVIS